MVESGRNGIILEEPNAASIANAVRDCIANPSRLQQFAAASRLPDEFTIDALGSAAARAWLGAIANDAFEFEICVLYCARRLRSWSRVN